MANTIKLKRGTGSDPSASDLVLGEIAIRTDTGKLFTKKDNGTVAEISGSGGGGSDIFINTLSSSSGSGGGSASFNGSATRFTLSNPPDVSAQQLLVSINGVIQKPNSGTSPSEGFALDGTDIIFAAAPATGADFFIITYGSIGVSVPADNSVTSAKIVDGAIVNADINASAAIAGTKISPDFGSQNIVTTGTLGSNDLTITNNIPKISLIDTDNDDDFEIKNQNGVFTVRDATNGADRLTIASDGQVNIGGAQFYQSNNVAIPIDGAEFKLGAGDDLKLYHDGSHSYIEDAGTGELRLKSNLIRFQGSNGEPLAVFEENSAVALYFDNSIKFNTNALGVRFIGHLRGIDNEKIQLGASQDLQLYHDGSNSYVSDSGTGQLRISSDELRINNAANSETMIAANQNQGVELYYNASKKFETISGGVQVTGELYADGVRVGDDEQIRFGDGEDLRLYHSGSHGILNNITGSFQVQDAGTEKFRVSGTGTFFKDDIHLSNDNDKLNIGAGNDLQVYHNGTNNYLDSANGHIYLRLNVSSSSQENAIKCTQNGNVEISYDASKKFETTSSGIKILGDASTGSIIQGDLRLKAADSGTTLVHWNPENNEIRWDDDYKAAFGDSGDLTISHSSTYNNSLIYNGTNDLYFRSGTAFYFQNKAGSENQATFVENGRVDLYYDNAKKLETKSGGVDIFGQLAMGDNNKHTFGNGDDLQIYHNGTSSFIDNHNSGHIYIRNNDGSDFGGNIYIQAKSGESSIDIIHDGSVQLFYNNDRVFYTETRGVRLADNTKIYENSSHNTAVIQHADIHHAIILRGATNNNGSTITNENTTTFREYGQMQFRTGGNGNMPVRLTIASNGVVSGNLNDTSDGKFKENIVSIADGAISKIKQLRPVNFDWKKEMQVEDAKGESGFIAQEVLNVIPDLVKGIEYKEDEKSSGYSVNTTGLVAYLTKALQEVIARLETLEGG